MKKIISIILCLAWMGFIFYNSSQNGLESNTRSKEILKSIKKYYIEVENIVKKPKSMESFNVNKEVKKADGSGSKSKNSSVVKNDSKTVNDKSLEIENYFIRKGAHALEYIVLAILISNVFFQFGIKNKNVIIYVLFIALFYAVLDEFHQSFVPNRTSEVGDVLLDFSGAIVGTVMWCKLNTPEVIT